jgi:leucyl aminopeptidase
MPIFPEHREELKASAQADLQSTGAGRYGGACTAAAFLENFVGHELAVNGRDKSAPAPASNPTPVAWAHLDIAGPGMQSKQRGHFPAGGTGFGVQAVTQYILSAPAGPLPADEAKKF